jgi:hypothetical protein
MLSIPPDALKQFDTDLEKRRSLSLSAPITGGGSGIIPIFAPNINC